MLRLFSFEWNGEVDLKESVDWDMTKDSYALILRYSIGLLRGPLMVAQWLSYCATNRKAAGSIPDGVIGIFH
jgi:hypothetical protein